jgi:hypothetical protein
MDTGTLSMTESLFSLLEDTFSSELMQSSILIVAFSLVGLTIGAVVLGDALHRA